MLIASRAILVILMLSLSGVVGILVAGCSDEKTNDVPPPVALTVEGLRMNLETYVGERVRVVGVLKPLEEQGDVVNVVLVPGKEFLGFSEYFVSPYYISLDLVRPEGGVRVKPDCFGRFVSINGSAGFFGGRPEITDIVFMLDIEGEGERQCLYQEE